MDVRWSPSEIRTRGSSSTRYKSDVARSKLRATTWSILDSEFFGFNLELAKMLLARFKEWCLAVSPKYLLAHVA
jgi:hypothetical protein